MAYHPQPTPFLSARIDNLTARVEEHLSTHAGT